MASPGVQTYARRRSRRQEPSLHKDVHASEVYTPESTSTPVKGPKTTSATRSQRTTNDDEDSDSLIKQKPSPTRSNRSSLPKRKSDENNDGDPVTPSPKKKTKVVKPPANRGDSSIWDELDVAIETSSTQPAKRTLSPRKQRGFSRPLPGAGGAKVSSPEGYDPTPVSPRNSLKNKMKLMSSLGKRTYGGGRSVAANEGSGGTPDDDVDTPDTPYDDDEPDVEVPEVDSNNNNTAISLNVQNINDLKAQGGNAEFVSDMEYVMEGLNGPVSAQKSVMLELLEKSHEPEFIHTFKITKFPQVLFQRLGNSNDEVLSFLLGWFCNKLLGDGDALAASLIRDFGLIDLFLKMVHDDQDIRTKKLDKLFQKSLQEVVKLDNPHDTVTISRQWVALNGLVALEELGPTVQTITQEKLKHKLPTFLQVLEKMLPGVLADIDDDGKLKKVPNLALLTTQVVFVSESMDVDDIIGQLDNFQSDTSPMEMLMGVTRRFFCKGTESLEVAVESIMKLAVMLSSQFASANVLHYSVFDADLAMSIVDYVANAADLAQVPGSLIAYASGLLYNLVDSETIQERLNKNSNLKLFKRQVLDFDIDNAQQNHKAGVSYLYLALARLKLDAKERRELKQLLDTKLDKIVRKSVGDLPDL